jgi:serine/threonine protein kinase
MAELVGRYEIVSTLRAGGMARVDLARLRGAYDFQRYVVIKRPLQHQASDPLALEQFRTESRLLAALHHPSVISFLDAGTDTAGVDFLALEYVHGMSLRDFAPPRGPQLVRRPSLAAALTIVKEIGDALDHAHDHGAIVHRDVSPSNVLLGYDGSIKLIDFGIAKLTDGATASGTLRGKITYMAPEQCKGEVIDRRTDVYALGVILYELVTGQRPFYADDDIASLHKIVTGAPPAHAATFGVDPDLADIVMRAMAHRASDRYESAAAFVAAIETHAAAREIVLANALVGEELGEVRAEPWRVAAPARPTAVTPQRARHRVFAVIGAGAVAAAAVAIYVGLARPPA